MKSRTLMRLLSAVAHVLSAQAASAMDMRFDVATDNNNGLDTVWFGSSQLVNLNFPSVNGHNIEPGNSAHSSALTAAGNTMGMYYDPFYTLYSSTETTAAAVSTIQSWANSQFGSGNTNRWLVLNEVDTSTWTGSSGAAYRTWLVGTMKGLHDAGYGNIILYAQSRTDSPTAIANTTYASTWQSIAQYAHIGSETYINGQVVKAANYSVSTLQGMYQASYNAWTSTANGAGLAASSVFLGEHFSVNNYDPSGNTYWGADGLSGTEWQQAIEARDVAIHNIPFGGFIGYAWDKNAQATGVAATDLASQISYERAYASTLVVQTEVPAWTGNDGTTSWADYLNWTGGLPSTLNGPFPLLAATNPNLPKQTTASFLTAIKANTTITLDGNQSITNLSLGSSFSYTIAPGTGGSLTMSGSGASIGVTSGSHFITAGLVIGSDVAANLAGNLTVSGGLTNNGHTLTKSGIGTMTISGPQTNAANSAIAVSAGTLNLNSDAGSPSSSTLAFSSSGGATVFNASQHLSSLSATGGGLTVSPGSTIAMAGSLSVVAGQILAHTGGLSVDNASTSAVSLAATANRITLDFDSPGAFSGPFWGLRWEGNHVSALQATLNQNGFTGNGSIFVEANPAYFDFSSLTVGTTLVGGLTYTYVGFASTVPEPGTILLLLPASLLMLGRRRGGRSSLSDRGAEAR